MSASQLICTCAQSNEGAAWDEFIARFHKPISISVFRTANQCGWQGDRIVDDLVQETYLKLCADRCKHLLEFVEQHPDAIVGYVKTVAANVAFDHFKAINARKRGSGNLLQPLDAVEPRGTIDGPGGQMAIERGALLRQINDCLTTCSKGEGLDRDRLIFWLYYQQGMTAKAIAELPTVGLTVKGVESAINRLTRMVREHIAAGYETKAHGQDLPGEKGFHPAESF
jgi:RNA polymerase sigma-70 factor (ECF subfamily)